LTAKESALTANSFSLSLIIYLEGCDNIVKAAIGASIVMLICCETLICEEKLLLLCRSTADHQSNLQI
jgi:hypothetical protein